MFGSLGPSSPAASSSASSLGGDDDCLIEFLKMLHARVKALEDASCHCVARTCKCFLIRAGLKQSVAQDFIASWVQDVGYQVNSDVEIEWVTDSSTDTVEAIAWLENPIPLDIAVAHALSGGAADVEITPLKASYPALLRGAQKYVYRAAQRSLQSLDTAGSRSSSDL